MYSYQHVVLVPPAGVSSTDVDVFVSEQMLQL